MLLEAKFAIKIEAQVPPVRLRLQWVALSVRLIAKIERWIVVTRLPGEVK
jgi:hypothetical protein